MVEYIEPVLAYAAEAWPFVVSTAAAIGGGTVGVLNFKKLKKTQLEIDKLEKEATTKEDPPKSSLIKIPTDEEIAKFSNVKVQPESKWPRKDSNV